MPRTTFDSFVEGDCNRLARSAGFAVAKQPGGTAFNPLVLYGGVGLGKTHMAQAIGNEVKNNFPNKTVLYVSSEKFTNQFFDAVKNNSVNDFVHFYQLIDVLIVDDIQFFGNKEKTQDIFFHIFNHLHQNGKQLVLTTDRSPRDLEGMEERLLFEIQMGIECRPAAARF
jgi:chromosomal replication initiator protein